MSRGRILVVDDDAAVRLFTVITLSTEGFDILEARCGDEALTVASAEKIDLIVLDKAMPGMTGIEVAHRLREENPGMTTPIVMLSAMVSDEDQWEGWRAGIDVYLTKPFEGEELIAQVVRLLSERGVRSEYPV